MHIVFIALIFSIRLAEGSLSDSSAEMCTPEPPVRHTAQGVEEDEMSFLAVPSRKAEPKLPNGAHTTTLVSTGVLGGEGHRKNSTSEERDQLGGPMLAD